MRTDIKNFSVANRGEAVTSINLDLIENLPSIARHQGIPVTQEGSVFTIGGTVDISDEAIAAWRASQASGDEKHG
jgi:hypothetical protein